MYPHLSDEELLNKFFLLANGDDCLTWGIDNIEKYVETFASIGITLRNPRQELNLVDYCSHMFNVLTGKAPLTSWPKLVHNLMWKTGLRVDAEQALDECRDNDNYNRIARFVASIFPNEVDVISQSISVDQE